MEAWRVQVDYSDWLPRYHTPRHAKLVSDYKYCLFIVRANSTQLIKFPHPALSRHNTTRRDTHERTTYYKMSAAPIGVAVRAASPSSSTVVVASKKGNRTRSASGAFFRLQGETNKERRNRLHYHNNGVDNRAASRPRAVECRAKNQDQDGEEQELDFVTRMVMNVFGKDVLDDPEPMGLKRMTREEWPDQW